MKPVCVPCQRFFRIKKSGYYFIEGMPQGRGVKAGTAEPHRWDPYKVWAGDLWECMGCGATIVSGVGQSRIAEHYEKDFKETVNRLGAAQLQVNDC